MTQTQNEAEFEFEWLLRQKYEFKILALIAVLADNNLAYRGTLKDMCEFFGVKPGNFTTNKQIKAAIEKLESDGLLKQIVDGRTFTLTLSKKGEQRKRVIRIQKEWVEIAKNYKSEENSIAWINLLKVWLYLIDNKHEIIKTSEIAEELSLSTDIIKRAKKALEQDIQAIVSKRRATLSANGGYRCLGSSITVKAWLDE